ncbi:MAG: hypothetical protein C0404_14685 [Verrucomicrobia bacterium]|nr:hypothetical protein [Verrucomicrobiota bacterium]
MKMKLVCIACAGLVLVGGGLAQEPKAPINVEGAGKPKAASPETSAAKVPGGPPKLELVASINVDGELDGPAKEAMGYGGRNGGGLPDAEGNLWGGGAGGNHWLRASDGRVLTLASCEYGTTGFDCGKDGPIAGRPAVKRRLRGYRR